MTQKRQNFNTSVLQTTSSSDNASAASSTHEVGARHPTSPAESEAERPQGHRPRDAPCHHSKHKHHHKCHHHHKHRKHRSRSRSQDNSPKTMTTTVVKDSTSGSEGETDMHSGGVKTRGARKSKRKASDKGRSGNQSPVTPLVSKDKKQLVAKSPDVRETSMAFDNQAFLADSEIRDEANNVQETEFTEPAKKKDSEFDEDEIF